MSSPWVRAGRGTQNHPCWTEDSGPYNLRARQELGQTWLRDFLQKNGAQKTKTPQEDWRISISSLLSHSIILSVSNINSGGRERGGIEDTQSAEPAMGAPAEVRVGLNVGVYVVCTPSSPTCKSQGSWELA